MSFFGIPGYQPQWLVGRHTLARAHGRRLHALIGRRLTESWLVFDRVDDQWIADCPVLLDFEGEQVELTHQKVDDLSITWNSIDPSEPITYGGSERHLPGVARRRVSAACSPSRTTTTHRRTSRVERQ